MRTSLRWLGLLFAGTACGGGGDGGTNNNPPPTAVASVEMSPTTAALGVPGSVQLSAIPRDASGVALSGRTISWYTSSSAVATVSSGGLVTAVGEGTAVITATVEGKSATATITVSVTQGGPVIAEAQIGPSGGTVGTNDVAVTIPAGALSSTQKVILVRDTSETTGFEENAASLVYRIDGIPPGPPVPARVRIKLTKPLSNQGAIAMGTPVARMSEFTDLEMGHRLFAATDSSGYLVATVPIRGRPASWSSVRAGLSNISLAPKVTPRDFKAAALLSGLVDVRHTASAGGHFEGWGFVRGATTEAEVMRQLNKTLPLMEQAYTKVQQMGYNYNQRTLWPIDVYVMPLTDNGLYYSVAPDPYDPNLGYFAMNSRAVDDAVEFPGVAIHEFFHFTQTGYTFDWGWARMGQIFWLNEATASWMMEYHPAAVSPWPAAIPLMLTDSLWTGVDRDLVGWSGYGKAPMIKYMANRFGADRVREMYVSIRGGLTPTGALLAAMGEPADTWWPDLLKQHLVTGIYPWSVKNRIPSAAPNLSLPLGTDLGVSNYAMRDAHTLFTEFDFIDRDTARFGPKYQLPIHLGAASRGKAKLMAFSKVAGAPAYTWIATGDTVLLPGNLLQKRDSVLLLIARTDGTDPYAGHGIVNYTVDLRPPEGDWWLTALRNLNDATHFACDKEGNTVTFNVADNAKQVWQIMAGFGTWKLKANTDPAVYDWTVSPEFADTLLKYKLTFTGALTLPTVNTVNLKARFAFDWTSAATPAPPADAGAGWLWLLLPLGALPFLFRGRARVRAAAASAVVGLAVVGCELGTIEMALDESFDYTFAKVRFTVDPADSSTVFMELRDGAGKTTITKYQSAYWSYIKDATGTITDSTKVTCTGSGNATYTADMDEYKDGVKPPSAPDLADVLARAAGVSPALVRARIAPPK